MEMPFTIEVILVNWHAAEDCAARLAGLRTWQMRARIWLVDNDGSLQAIALQAHEHILTPPQNLGFGGGINHALEAIARLRDVAPAVLLINPDAIVDETCVAGLLARLQAEPRIAIVGPRLTETDLDGKVHTYCGGRDPCTHLNTRIPCDSAACPNHLRDVDYVPGTVALLSWAALQDASWLDMQFFFSGELAEWCLRVRRRQWRAVVDCTCAAVHVHRADRATAAGLYLYYSLRNRLLLCAKLGRRDLMTKWAMRYAALALRHLARGRFSDACWTVLAALHGLRRRGGLLQYGRLRGV